MRAFLFGLVVLAACSKGGASEGGGTGLVLTAWQKAGLEPGTFEPVENKAFGAGQCRAGKVRSLDATVCEYADVADAKRAETSGMAGIQGGTGLALAEGKMLLVLLDTKHSDPSGKSMNEVARVFRNK